VKDWLVPVIGSVLFMGIVAVVMWALCRVVSLICWLIR
jgi:hypothetical protein